MKVMNFEESASSAMSGDLQPFNREDIRRIAVIRALHLGDLLLAVPALRALRRGFPLAEITLIGLPWAEAFAARFMEYVDHFAVFPGWQGIGEVPYVAKRTAKWLDQQRERRYDLVVQMHGSGRASNPFALALGGRYTAGYVEGMPPVGMTLAAPYPTYESETLRNLGLARVLGCPADDTRLEFPIHREDRAEAAVLLAKRSIRRGRSPLIGFHAGAKIPARRWPASYFAELADSMTERYGAQIVLTGSADEAEIAHSVTAHMRTPAINVVGKTTLGGLAAVIDQLDLFVGNDTGPAHLAEAVGTPSVTIFGPAELRRWASLDQEWHPTIYEPVACSPCGFAECPIDHGCLRRITPERVFAVAEDLLMKGGVACGA